MIFKPCIFTPNSSLSTPFPPATEPQHSQHLEGTLVWKFSLPWIRQPVGARWMVCYQNNTIWSLTTQALPIRSSDSSLQISFWNINLYTSSVLTARSQTTQITVGQSSLTVLSFDRDNNLPYLCICDLVCAVRLLPNTSLLLLPNTFRNPKNQVIFKTCMNTSHMEIFKDRRFLTRFFAQLSAVVHFLFASRADDREQDASFSRHRNTLQSTLTPFMWLLQTWLLFLCEIKTFHTQHYMKTT